MEAPSLLQRHHLNKEIKKKPLCGPSSLCLRRKTNQSAYLGTQRERRRLFPADQNNTQEERIVTFRADEWVGGGGG